MRARVRSLDSLRKGGGPYIGPKGGLYADPAHTIPWNRSKHGHVKPSNCPRCKGVAHVISRQTSLAGGEAVSSAPCRTCNKGGKHPLNEKRAKQLGLPVPKPKRRSDTAPPEREQAAKPHQMGLDFQKPQQQSLFGAMAKGGPYIGPRGGKWADAKHTIPWKEQGSGTAGQREMTPPKALGMWPFTLHVEDRGGDTVKIANTKGGPGPSIPRESLPHFVRDLEGRVKVPEHPSNDAINAVREGKGKLLGKGDDGLVFKVGDQVVKVSTTVPFQPFNPGHRTPKAAVAMLRKQAEIGNKLADAGVPGIQRSTFIEHGDKGFQIKPYVEIPEKFTQAQMDEAQEALHALHDAGYVLNDDIQLGLDKRGKVVLFDIGKATRKEDAGEDRVQDEIADLASLYRRQGLKFTQTNLSPAESEWSRVDSMYAEVHKLGETDLRKLREDAFAAAEAVTKERGKPLKGRDAVDELQPFLLDEIDYEMEKFAKSYSVEAYPIDGYLEMHGLRIAIENGKGSKRRWVDYESGDRGETVMVHPYGYLVGTEGADGDEVDVYVGPNRASERVFVINQRRIDDKRRFDEHKVMLGFDTEAQARAAYLRHYDDNGPGMLGSCVVWDMDRFKQWLSKRGAKKKPLRKAEPGDVGPASGNPAVQHFVRVRPTGYIGGPEGRADGRALPRARLMTIFGSEESAVAFVNGLGRSDVLVVPEHRVEPADRLAVDQRVGAEPWYVLEPAVERLMVGAR